MIDDDDWPYYCYSLLYKGNLNSASNLALYSSHVL